MRFGLHYVDYKDPHRSRYPKDSARWYRNYVTANRDNYTGIDRVIVPIHRPVRVNDDDWTTHHGPYGGILPISLVDDRRPSLTLFWTKLTACHHNSKQEVVHTIVDTDGELISIRCEWWETWLSAYVFQFLLQAGWNHDVAVGNYRQVYTNEP